MIFILAAAGFIWAFIMLLFGPLWQKTLALTPAFIYCTIYIHPAFSIALILSALPLVVADIQVLPDGMQLDGMGKYMAYVPSVIAAAVFLYFVHPRGNEESLLRAIIGIVFALVMIVWGFKILITDPVLLFINRLSTSGTELVEKRFVKLEQRTKYRNPYYYIKLYAAADLQVSGICYLYIYFNNLQPDDILIFRYKTGWLGIKYLSGFPVVQRVAH